MHIGERNWVLQHHNKNFVKRHFLTFLSIFTSKISLSLIGSRLKMSPLLNSCVGLVRIAVLLPLEKLTQRPDRGWNIADMARTDDCRPDPCAPESFFCSGFLSPFSAPLDLLF